MDNDSITAIVIVGIPTIVWGGYACLRAWMRHVERKIEIMGYLPNAKTAVSETADLEEKIRQVQQTSTEYDLSIQHTLDNIQRRLDFIERHSLYRQPAIKTSSADEEPQIQRSGINTDQS